jgi:hypothetical protein
VVWDQPADLSIRSQMFQPDGSALRNEFRVDDPPGSFRQPAVGVSLGGDIVVAWERASYPSWISFNIRDFSYGQPYTANVFVDDGSCPHVCAGVSGFVLVYEKSVHVGGTLLYQIVARRYLWTGAQLGGPIVVAEDDNPVWRPRVDCRNGNFGVVWNQAGGARFQAFTLSGPSGPQHNLDGDHPDIALLLEATYHVVYRDWSSIQLVSYDLSGNPDPAAFRVDDPASPGTPHLPAIGAGSGQIVVSWVQQDVTQYQVMAAQYHFDSDPQVNDWVAVPWQEFGNVQYATLSTAFSVFAALSFDWSMDVARPTYFGRFVIVWNAQPLWQDVVMRCFDRYGKGTTCGVDMDNDGVLNHYDCDPRNPFLRYDLDTDGICEEIIGGDVNDCLGACLDAYTSDELDDCNDRCQNLDNCPCLDLLNCPDINDRKQDHYVYIRQFNDVPGPCQVYRDCIDARSESCDQLPEAEACHVYFANPGQHDSTGNKRGDFCEDRLQGTITRFAPSWEDFSTKGHITVCAGLTYDVDVQTTGKWAVDDWGYAPMPPGWHPEGQRISVGACACTEQDRLSGWCSISLFNCPKTTEQDDYSRLVFHPILADEAVLIDQVDQVDPSYPVTVGNEAPFFADHVHNKYQEFSPYHASNTLRFSWRWQDWDKFEDVLPGKEVELRLAWQDPAAQQYEYVYTLPLPTVHYSDNIEPIGVSCISQAILWELPDQVPWVWLVPKPWGYTAPPRAGYLDPPRMHPGPWALLRDGASDNLYLVSYGVRMQPSGFQQVTYKAGSTALLEHDETAVAAAMLDTSRFGVPSSKAPVIFQYGGLDETGDWTNNLWLGFPQSEQNLWLQAKDIWGPQAGQGPTLIHAQLIHHARGRRLIAMGDRREKVNGRYVYYYNEVWTFDLDTGRWWLATVLDIDVYLRTSSMSLDPLRNRVLIYYSQLIEGTEGVPRTYIFDLDRLVATEVQTTPAPEGPFGLWYHGAYLEPLEQALYVYGGFLYDKTLSPHAYRLDLHTWEWSYLGDGTTGPGARVEPFVTYDRVSGRLWISGGGEDDPGALVYWGLKDGEWIKHATLEQRDVDDFQVEGTFDLHKSNDYAVTVPDATEWPGPLLVAELMSSDPDLGLVVLDSTGQVVGVDLDASTTNTVTFYAHSIYIFRVVAGPGYDPATHPTFTLTLRRAELVEVAGWTGSAGVNDLLVQGDVAFLVGTGGLDAVSLADPLVPQAISHLDLGGSGQSIAPCGPVVCVAQAKKGKSLRTLDLGDPANIQSVGTLQTPGLPASLAVKGQSWVYLADGGAGVSIIDAREPAALQMVDRLVLPGVVTAVAVSANRLYVASRPQNIVRIYEITDEESPVLLGQLDVAATVEAMRVSGTALHVAGHAGNGWQGCQSGQHCPRGTQVEVFDVSDPAEAVKVAEYDGDQDPFVHIKPHGDYGLVRTYDGFAVYQWL